MTFDGSKFKPRLSHPTNHNKHAMFLSCLFHFNMNIGLVMQSLGGNYMSTHCNVEAIIKEILQYADKDLILYFCYIMVMGYLNVFNTSLLHQSFLIYLAANNNPSINNNLINVMKTTNKEECNNFIIPKPVWISLFVIHIFLIPQHNLVKEEKKERLIFNAAEQPTMEAIPINLITSNNQGTELDCTSSMVMIDLLIHIWNLHISFPDHDIDMHSNHVEFCFWKLKHQPDVMGDFLFIIGELLSQ